jgi:hypothetical protein
LSLGPEAALLQGCGVLIIVEYPGGALLGAPM